MIHPCDTPPPVPSKPYRYLDDAMAELRCECRLEMRAHPNWYELYVDPRFYRLAQIAVYYTVPAFVRVDIIPLEFTS